MATFESTAGECRDKAILLIKSAYDTKEVLVKLQEAEKAHAEATHDLIHSDGSYLSTILEALAKAGMSQQHTFAGLASESARGTSSFTVELVRGQVDVKKKNQPLVKYKVWSLLV